MPEYVADAASSQAHSQSSSESMLASPQDRSVSLNFQAMERLVPLDAAQRSVRASEVGDAQIFQFNPVAGDECESHKIVVPNGTNVLLSAR